MSKYRYSSIDFYTHFKDIVAHTQLELKLGDMDYILDKIRLILPDENIIYDNMSPVTWIEFDELLRFKTQYRFTTQYNAASDFITVYLKYKDKTIKINLLEIGRQIDSPQTLIDVIEVENDCI